MKIFAALTSLSLLGLISMYPVHAQPINPEIKRGGYLQVRYTTDENEIDEFRIRRARLKISGNFANDVRFLLLLDATTTPILWKAHIDVAFLPCFSLRAGQFKTPFSHEYLTSSAKLSTIDRSQAVTKLAMKYDIGLQANGRFECLKYDIGMFNGTGKNEPDDNNFKDIVGMIVAQPIKDGEIGLSYYFGKSGLDKEKKDRIGAYISIAHSSLTIDGEFIHAQDGSLKRNGWYAQLAYFFLFNLQGLIRYDTYDPDKNIPGNSSKVLIVGLNFFKNRNTKLQINYLIMDDGEKTDVIKTQIQISF